VGQVIPSTLNETSFVSPISSGADSFEATFSLLGAVTAVGIDCSQEEPQPVQARPKKPPIQPQRQEDWINDKRDRRGEFFVDIL
jgi:hypothetical protein